jgi:hypothetical protein
VKTQQTERTVRAIVNCKMCESALALQLLLIIPSCKCVIKPITNPNPAYSHLTCDNIIHVLPVRNRWSSMMILNSYPNELTSEIALAANQDFDKNQNKILRANFRQITNTKVYRNSYSVFHKIMSILEINST